MEESGDFYTYLIIVFVGAGMLLWCIDRHLRHKETLGWPRVTAQILGATTVVIGDEGDRVYAPRLSVEFSFMDETHTHPRMKFSDEEFGDPESALACAREAEKAGTLELYVEPGNPLQAVHHVSLPASFRLILVTGLILTGFGIFALIIG